VAALAGLTTLQNLDLGDTRVSDLTALAALTNLQSLDLWDAPVSDVAALAGLTNLGSLDLRGTRVRDFTALRHIQGLEIERDRRKRTPKQNKPPSGAKKRARSRQAR
jgi:Leucine-rich repeat (LRR) protein